MNAAGKTDSADRGDRPAGGRGDAGRDHSVDCGDSGSSASDNLQSGQALFLADSGVEFEARSMVQNLDWYRSPPIPTDAGDAKFRSGSFTVSLRISRDRAERAGVSETTVQSITVYTSSRFPTFSGARAARQLQPCYWHWAT